MATTKKQTAKKATAKKATAKKSAAPKAKKAPAKKQPKQAEAEAPKPTRRKKAEGTYAELAANRFHESKVENPVRAMWDLCDKMVENRRKDVIAAAVAAGISYYTARTQYQLWLTAYRNSK
jgi:hypothetical protein